MQNASVIIARQERPFGFVLALLLAALGAWRLYSADEGAYLLVGAIAVAVVTAACPRAWRPVLRAWMPIAHAMGWFNTRVLLAAVFFLLITPLGLVMRLFGYDPLRLRARGQGWTVRGEDYPPASFKEPF